MKLLRKEVIELITYEKESMGREKNGRTKLMYTILAQFEDQK